MRDEYIAQIIMKLEECRDAALLDLILQLLDKSIQEAV